MGLREILDKFRQTKAEQQQERNEGMSANETELLSYKKKEYNEAVKRELQRYRERERNNLWKGKTMNDEHQIIKAKNVFKGQPNVFNCKRRKSFK